MTDGYYWYFPSELDEEPDLQGEPQIVEVFRSDSVALCGSDITYILDLHCHGRFVGPIEKPTPEQP